MNYTLLNVLHNYFSSSLSLPPRLPFLDQLGPRKLGHHFVENAKANTEKKKKNTRNTEIILANSSTLY